MDKVLKAVIIEDEAETRDKLKKLLPGNGPIIEVIAETSSINEGKKLISQLVPDIIFLNIEMEDGTGFQLLSSFPKREFKTIIIASSDKYALRAIKESALDYILKPIDEPALKRAINKIGQEHSHSKMVDGANVALAEVKQVALPTLEGFTIIETNEILYAAADGSYTTFHLTGKRKLTVSRNLKEYNKLLQNSGFFRIHHSLLVNLIHVRKYTRGKSGCVELTDGTHLEVAFRRRDEFMRVLNNI